MLGSDESVEVAQSGGLQAPLLAATIVGSDPYFRAEVMSSQPVGGVLAVPVATAAPSAPYVAPPAMAMWPGRSMSLGETIISDSKVYQSVPKDSCFDECQMFCCPWCPSVSYRASPKHGGQTLSFNNPCTWCCCCCSDWRVQLGGRTLGHMSLPGCCDNGCFFCMCSACLCSGTYSILNFNVNGHMKYTIRRKLYCCWSPIEAAATCCCLPCIGCCNNCTQCPCDSCAYCFSQNAVVTEEAVFPGMGHGNHQVGGIRMVETIAFKQGSCIPVRTLASFQVRFLDHSMGSHEDTLLLGLLPMMWRGLETSGCCPSVAPIRKSSGDWCLNGGRMVNEQYMTFTKAMALVENPLDKLANELGVEVDTDNQLGKVSAEAMAPVPAVEMER